MKIIAVLKNWLVKILDSQQYDAGRKAAEADLKFRYGNWSCRGIVDHFKVARCFLQRFEGTEELPEYWELANKSFKAGYRDAILAHFEVGVQSQRAGREAELKCRRSKLEKVGGRPE